MRKVLIIISILLGFSSIAEAQKINWSVDFNTIFDNREGGNDLYSPDETIFETRLAPEIGVSFLDGQHSIAGGVAWIQPIGNEWHDAKFCPTIYYRYQSPRLKFNFGMFPRTYLISPLPNALWSDKMVYNEPNIRGALVQYLRAQGYLEFFLDWRQMQTETQREAFNINVNANWQPGNKPFMLGGHIMMNHYAKQKNAPETQGIVDNFIVNPYVGVNLSKKTVLDSLTIKGGLLMSIYRDRAGLDKWQNQAGGLFEIVAEWKFLGINNTLYAGKHLFPLYNKYGEALDLGEPYYVNKFYNRTNIYAYIFRNPFVNLEASLNFHVTDDAFGFQQQLLLRVYLDNNLWGLKGKKLKNQPNLQNIF